MGKNDHTPVPDPVGKTIYIVTSGEYSDYSVDATFSTYEKAEAFTGNSGGWEIQKWILDEREDESAKTVWGCRLHLKTGDVDQEWKSIQVCVKRYTCSQGNKLYVWGHSSVSPEHARKLAAEKRQEFLRRDGQ